LERIQPPWQARKSIIFFQNRKNEFDPELAVLITWTMRLLLISVLLISFAYCRYGDEDPQSNFFLLPDENIHLSNGVYFEGNAVQKTCVSDKLVNGTYDTTRCNLLNTWEPNTLAAMPNNIRMTLKMQENLKSLKGDMRIFIMHIDGVPYDFYQEIVGTTQIGSSLTAPVFRLGPKSGGPVTAELNPDYSIRISEFSAEQADYTMPGRLHLLLNKVGESETIDMEYVVMLRKVY
jgi:hypothetical protein